MFRMTYRQSVPPAIVVAVLADDEVHVRLRTVRLTAAELGHCAPHELRVVTDLTCIVGRIILEWETVCKQLLFWNLGRYICTAVPGVGELLFSLHTVLSAPKLPRLCGGSARSISSYQRRASFMIP